MSRLLFPPIAGCAVCSLREISFEALPKVRKFSRQVWQVQNLRIAHVLDSFSPTPMRFIVCIRQVPDVAAPTRLEGSHIVQDSDRMVLNAYDASAVEECLVLRDAHGGEVDVVSIGPDRASEAIRKALAMGADRGTHIRVDSDESLDSRSIAIILAAYLAGADFGVVACGKQSQDTDAGLTGSMLATMLQLPFTTNAVALAIEDERLIVTRQADTGREIIALPSPCLVTCSNDMNNPRIPSLKGIMMSKKKPIEVVELGSLELDESLSKAASLAATVIGEEEPPPRPGARLLDGETSEMVSSLIDALENDARVI
jgi:electron transfer flavoprotein beta subunit